MSSITLGRPADLLRRPLMRIAALVSAAALAACQPVEPTATGAQTGPLIDPSQPVQVALLVPADSGDANYDYMARSMANAARMAVADAQGARIDLRVYNSGDDAAQAVAMANKAVAEGAKVIVGPLHAESANAVGNAVRGRVNVLSFSNNADIAGGNLFVLGNTFGNTADRLVSYGVRQGLRRFLIVHESDVAGQIGGAAIEGAIARNRATMVGKTAHGMTRAQMDSIAPTIAQAAAANQAQAVFLTGNQQSVLPEITAALANAGLNSSAIQMMGLTRWDIPASRMSLPQLQNGWFAIPDTARMAEFNARYRAAYGENPHDFATLAYDGVSAIAANVRAGRKNAVTTAGLTQGAGFAGIQGAFRLRPDGTNQRQLSVATLQGGRLVVIDPARRSFGGFGL
ncbi:penicillin-binding protein activator [Paracoccus sphaerophysae]|uniref:ABC transporter substrate-binding protein n=1 Tax=Paracoccus sphaerophysae TaxID=690417 RepID=A0A099F9U3_9RHOB|nr:penicillin-binding protein activator [Paracoccus sphaerophysae]KGJ06862.1 ABC transporter substrate-binding protein [Paracoccus sphaerophysae]